MTACGRRLCSAIFAVVSAALSVAFAGVASGQEARGGTHPFEYKPDAFRADAVLDLRSMNERQAGEHGFIELSEDGESFVTGEDKKPIRFWAVGSDAAEMKPGDVATQARFLAKLGVNMVRFHVQIAPEHGAITDVNQKVIDGVWRAVAEMKKQGIYVTISPYWATGKDATRWDIAGYGGQTDFFGILFFNEQLQKGYKAWVKALYTPTNPYTGIPLAKDPAVAVIQVHNEDGMFFWTMQGLKPEQKKVLGERFAAWAGKKYGSLEKAGAAWGNTRAEGDDLGNGTAGFMLVWNWTTQAPPATGGAAKRLADQLEFFADVQRGFYADMVKYYHDELGCKQLVNGSNWITADPVSLNDAERYSASVTQVMAVNRYHDGKHEGKNNGWRIDPGDKFTNADATIAPRTLPTNVVQPVGHPFLITESTWVAPEGTQFQAPFLIAAYQSVSGVDAYYWFSDGDGQYNPDPYFNFVNTPGGHAMQKWTCSVPALMGQFPAAALLFRKGYVTTPEPVVHVERTLRQIWDRTPPLVAEDANFDPNRSGGRTGAAESNLKGGGTVDPLAFLVGPVEVKYDGDPAKTKAVDLSKYVDHSAGTVTSATGEVKMDFKRGVTTIDAPKAQGATGQLAKVGQIKLKDVTLSSGNDQASVLVVSMDEKPLATSGRVLVQFGAKTRPTGFRTEPAEKVGDNKSVYTIEKTGTMPWRIDNADVTLTLRNAAIKSATLLDSAGYAAGEVPVRRQGEAVTVKLPAGAMYVVLR